jgi:hypothetical protein
MPADGYNGKDIIEIGKDLADKHPEMKDYSDEEFISGCLSAKSLPISIISLPL